MVYLGILDDVWIFSGKIDGEEGGVMEREKKIDNIVLQLRQLIKETQPRVCCFGEFDRHDDAGNVIGTDTGYDGYFDLKLIAEWIYVRMG